MPVWRAAGLAYKHTWYKVHTLQRSYFVLFFSPNQQTYTYEYVCTTYIRMYMCVGISYYSVSARSGTVVGLHTHQPHTQGTLRNQLCTTEHSVRAQPQQKKGRQSIQLTQIGIDRRLNTCGIRLATHTSQRHFLLQ